MARKGIEIEVDPKEVLDMFKDLTGKEQKKATRNALKKGANILRNATRKTLQSSVKKSIRKKYVGRNGKRYKSMADGIKVNAMSPEEVKVHIMGEFRLKWFELGTEPRRRKYWSKTRGIEFKRGGKTGKIVGKHFFKRAQQQTEQKIFSDMDNYLANAIYKIAQKHK